MTVCILGNSLTALTLAKILVNYEIDVDVIFNKKNYKINHTRTIGISSSNIDFFNTNIINIEKLIWNIKAIEIFTENFSKEKLINFKADKNQLFSIIKNYELHQLLNKELSKSKFFRLKFSTEKNLSYLNKYELVINCDSFNSITKKYFSKKISKKYNSTAYTTIISHDKIINTTAVQIFTKKGPLAFLPISNKKTSIVYSVHNSNNGEEENIKELIKDKNFKYKIKEIEKINNFELKSFNLRSYYHKNILAFGDLLHRVHPLAGQGFNMTIRDIKVLSEIIKKRLDIGLLLDNSVGLEFQNKIKHKNFIFSNGIDLIHEFFNIERKTRTNFLSKSVKLVGSQPTINRMFSKIADKGTLF
jgi:2-octaprenyl-6-methoxyphenol hydroxylase